jgi:hypothetical protein
LARGRAECVHLSFDVRIDETVGAHVTTRSSRWIISSRPR